MPGYHTICERLLFSPAIDLSDIACVFLTVQPAFFGGSTDGPGWSLVFYFTLNDDFDPETFPNKKALGLFKRFVQNGKEADGTPTRDRYDTWGQNHHL